LLEARTPSIPPTTMNSSTTADEASTTTLVFIDIGFVFLGKEVTS